MQELPAWFELYVAVASTLAMLWGGFVLWQMSRGLNRLDRVSEQLAGVDKRLAVLEERLPRSVSEELDDLRTRARTGA